MLINLSSLIRSDIRSTDYIYFANDDDYFAVGKYTDKRKIKYKWYDPLGLISRYQQRTTPIHERMWIYDRSLDLECGFEGYQHLYNALVGLLFEKTL